MPLAHNYPRRARAVAAGRGAGADASPGWKTPPRPRSASTSSTTPTCSPTTASRCAATRTTPCCRATCSKRTCRIGLEKLAERHLGRRPLLRRPVRQGREPIPFAQVDIGKAAEYSGEDSDMTLAVHQTLWPQLEAEPGNAFRLREDRDADQRAPGAHRAQRRADRRGLLAAQSHELGERMVALEQEAYELAGQPFNLGSPKQIGDILFTKLGLPVKKKTASGTRRPTRKCWPNWPPTTRCRPRSSSTAALPS